MARKPCNVVLQAPEEKFRVVGFDSFDGEDWLVGDYDSMEEALKIAKQKGGVMTLMHVYDDQGKHLKRMGTF